jgi:hypothetical protein
MNNFTSMTFTSEDWFSNKEARILFIHETALLYKNKVDFQINTDEFSMRTNNSAILINIMDGLFRSEEAIIVKVIPSPTYYRKNN